MPRFLMFAPCENVILADGNASLITIMHQLSVTLPPDVPDPLPTDAAIPLRWFVYAQWEILADDIGIPLQQRIALVGNKDVFEHILDFTPEPEKVIHRVVSRFDHFPLIPNGDYRLKLFLRRAGEENWTEKSDYPFRFVTKDETQND